MQKIAKNSPYAPSHNFVGLCLRNWRTYRQSEKLVKQQYLPHMFSQYGELRPTGGWDRFTSLGHPSKFQWVSCVGFITAQTSLNGGQPNCARCFTVFWAGTLHIHFPGLLPLREFCQVQNSLCVQVLHSSILAALLHTALKQWAWAKLCGVVQGLELRRKF